MAVFPGSSSRALPSLQYLQEGRSGKVIYRDAHGDIGFYYEFGGGECVAVINIPTVENWTAETGRSTTERDKILRFVAERTTRDQTKSGSWRIRAHWIEILQ